MISSSSSLLGSYALIEKLMEVSSSVVIFWSNTIGVLQVELFPLQIPHSSTVAVPPHIPLQSWIQSLVVSVSHVPQLSYWALPPQNPKQSWIQSLEIFESHAPHSSYKYGRQVYCKSQYKSYWYIM